jgi:AAA+ superfamily predicted ATPase
MATRINPATSSPADVQPKAHVDFVQQFSLHDGSGCGVIFARSREPQRVLESLRIHSRAKGREFRHWNAIQGWVKLDHTNGEEKPVGPPSDVMSAMKGIEDVTGGTASFPDPGYYVMNGLHPFLSAAGSDKPNPVLIALILYYAQALSFSKRRLIINIPESFIVPQELAHDVPVIDYGLPDTVEIRNAITRILHDEGEGRGGAAQTYTPAEMDILAGSLAGLTKKESEDATAQGLIKYADKTPRIPFADFNAHLMEAKTETVKQTGSMSVMKTVPLEEIGGLDLLKEWIVARRRDFTPEAKAYGVPTPKGLTEIGPPGTGKSLMASAVAAVLECPAIEIHFAALFGGIVGQTENNVRRLIKQMKAIGRAVFFIDEIDRVMGMNTTGGDGGITKRVIGEFLTFMQNNDTGAFMLFAANNAEGIDSALIRPGRVDAVFSVLPPNRAERLQILQIHLRKMKQDAAKVAGLAMVADKSTGYVGAELERAVAASVSQSFATNKPVTGEMILSHIQQIKPLSLAFAESFERQRKWAEANAQPASTPDKTEPALTVLSKPVRRRTIDNN